MKPHNSQSSVQTAPAEPPTAADVQVGNTNIGGGLPFFDEKRLCADLGISSVTATKWRAQAKGPPFIKVGRLVRYRRADVEAWLASCTVGRISA